MLHDLLSWWTNDRKVKLFQALVYIGGLVTLAFFWDPWLFVSSVVLGWLMFGLGVSLCLHRLSSHKTFIPKHRLIKVFLIFCGTLVTLGSTICWATGHRMHHAHADTDKDPHPPRGNFWAKVRMWFYYFPPYEVTPTVVRDLLSDKDHVWFHRNYYKVIVGYCAALALIDPVLVGYFYCVTVLYSLLGISWVTVLAHIPAFGRWGYRIFNVTDYTYNSHTFGFLLFGEGYHNTHHANPGLHRYELLPGEFDIGGRLIEVLGEPVRKPVRAMSEPRKGKHLMDELADVRTRLNALREVA